MISRDERKKQRGFKKFLLSVKYAFDGIKYALRSEQNLLIDFVITFIVIVISILLKVSNVELLILLITISLVIAFELLNTSLEAITDLITEKYHPLAKIAKDTSSGAVLVLAFFSVIEGLIIFIPKIIDIIK